MEFSLQLPINPVSFGQVSIALLREFHAMGLQPCLFPIGEINLGGQPITEDFHKWLVSCLNKAPIYHNRNTPSFKLWHLNDSFQSISNKQLLYSFYELDSPTEAEINAVKNNSVVAFSSSFAVEKFTEAGANNVIHIPLGFDEHNFKPLDKVVHPDGRIVFNILGKLERRKLHLKAIRAWLSRFGNNRQFFLQCGLHNVHYKPEEHKALYNEITEGRHFFNIEFYDYMPSNEEYNAFINSCSIVLGMSGGEGWGLPEFHSVALGKHAVIHNCSGYKDWANKDNSVLVESRQKINAHDGKFFINGAQWNQGNIFVFDDNEFIHACETALAKNEDSSVNWNGLLLRQKFTYRKMAESIVKEMEKLV